MSTKDTDHHPLCSGAHGPGEPCTGAEHPVPMGGLPHVCVEVLRAAEVALLASPGLVGLPRSAAIEVAHAREHLLNPSVVTSGAPPSRAEMREHLVVAAGHLLLAVVALDDTRAGKVT